MKNNVFDKYYTTKKVAKFCLSTIEMNKYGLAIEPSSGIGSFFDLIDIPKIGIDIVPSQSSGILKYDFLNWEYEGQIKNILVVGNPPFGKNSSLAVKFFNHAARFAKTISFVLPRTFRKPSVINRLDCNFTLEKERVLPEYSFFLENGDKYNVPCIWQIWNYSKCKREKIKIITKHKDFEFVKDITKATCMVQRVGVNAGAVHKKWSKSEKSHYFIDASDEVCNTLKSIKWDKDGAKYDTAGCPSISKNDLIAEYEKLKNHIDKQK